MSMFVFCGNEIRHNLHHVGPWSDDKICPGFHFGKEENKMPGVNEDQPFTHRWELLDGALKAVTGDRNHQYGAPDQDFTRTAELWSAWKGVHFDPWEVAVFQILLKTSRLSWNPMKADSWMDIAGYSACGHETAQIQQPRSDA